MATAKPNTVAIHIEAWKIGKILGASQKDAGKIFKAELLKVVEKALRRSEQ